MTDEMYVAREVGPTAGWCVYDKHINDRICWCDKATANRIANALNLAERHVRSAMGSPKVPEKLIPIVTDGDLWMPLEEVILTFITEEQSELLMGSQCNPEDLTTPVDIGFGIGFPDLEDEDEYDVEM